MTTEKYLNIPEKIHVGFGKSSTYYNANGQLSYVTYYKKDGSIAKETSFNGWIDPDKEQLTFDNTPVDGISIVGGGGGKPRWCKRQAYCQIKDDRGFEYQISYDNLLFILSVYSYNNGKFDGLFVYAWDGANLVLLPIVSQDYEYTRDMDEKVSYQPKDCVPGQYYTDIKSTLKEVYLYLGKLPVISTKTNDSKHNPGYHNYDIHMSSINRFIFYNISRNLYIDTPASITSKQFILNTDNICTEAELQQYVQKYYKDTFNTNVPLKKNFKGISEFVINDSSVLDIVPFTTIENIQNTDIDLNTIISTHRGTYKTPNVIIGISKDKKSFIYYGSLYQICTNSYGNMIMYDWNTVSRIASSGKTFDELYEFAKEKLKIFLGVQDQYNKKYYLNDDGSFTFDASRNYNRSYTSLSDIISDNSYDIYVIQNIKNVAAADIIPKAVLLQTSEDNIKMKFPTIYRF